MMKCEILFLKKISLSQYSTLINETDKLFLWK